ncbi:MAG: UDP-N-acetylmuramoyl-L-alanine--D-glutamate ligase [Burkholderiaceae bacterium]
MKATTDTTLNESHNRLALAGQRALVLGLGESGLAMVRYLLEVGAVVRVVDTRDNPPGLATLQERYPDAEFECQALPDVNLDEADFIAWSPGLSNEIGDGKHFFDAASERHIPVLGELDLFADALRASNIERERNGQPAAKVIGITGTNGKTTVTELVGMLARGAGLKVGVAGNIGPAMLNAWCDVASDHDLPDIWVLELSSFQLALAQPMSVDAAAILNISQDHLDWHADMATYIAAKHRVVGKESVAVGLRGDDSTLVDGCRRQQTIGTDEPTRAGDMGIVHDGGMPWLAWAVPAELPIPGKKTKADVPVMVKRLMPADALLIRGQHNHLNALAALCLAESVGVPMAAMLHALRDYKGQAHRCELVAIVDDVEYYNDSKGTNVGATVAALNGLDKRCWLIAGGIGKDQDFSALADAALLNAAGVILIGRDRGLIRQALARTGLPIHDDQTMDEALIRARDLAQAGQAVLLSPACSSFDMFDNYQHRGDVFRALVQEWALVRGNSLEVPC